MIGRNLETNINFFALIQLVSVLDRIGNRFPDRHSNPMGCVLIEAHKAGDAIGDGLYEIEVFQCATDTYLNLVGICIHPVASTRLVLDLRGALLQTPASY
jgi:hypothetical protein